ncbi:MAG: hypothetical protein AB9903_09040 [Vulcanimicrobiota bacterium]
MHTMLISALIVMALAGDVNKTIFSILIEPGYPQPQKTLERLVSEKGTEKVNHFHIVGYRSADGDDLAWVYWVEGRALILWEPTASPEYPVSLSTSRRYLRLDKDVVSSEEDVHGSTYLVTRAWADSVIKDCIKNGSHFVVRRPG